MIVDLTKRTPAQHAKASRDSLNRVAGPLVLACSLALVVSYWNTNHQAREAAERDREAAEYTRLVTDCQSEHNRAVVDAIAARAKLSTLQNEQVARSLRAVQTLVVGAGRTVRNPPTTPAQQRAADELLRQLFANYDAAIVTQARTTTQLAKQRAAAPLPKFPDCTAAAIKAIEATPRPTAP